MYLTELVLRRHKKKTPQRSDWQNHGVEECVCVCAFFASNFRPSKESNLPKEGHCNVGEEVRGEGEREGSKKLK